MLLVVVEFICLLLVVAVSGVEVATVSRQQRRRGRRATRYLGLRSSVRQQRHRRHEEADEERGGEESKEGRSTPTAVSGGHINCSSGNAHHRQSQHTVTEADSRQQGTS